MIKNVAGYDLAKLFAGSYGTLGAIVEVAVRLHPIPQRRVTAVGKGTAPAALAGAARALSHAALDAVCLDIAWTAGGGAVLARFGGVQPSETAADAARALAGGGLDAEVVDDDYELWAEQRAGQRSTDGVIIRVSGVQTDLERMIGAAERAGGSLVARAALGIAWIKLPAATADEIAALRRDLEPLPCVLLDAPPELRATVDPWGAPADALTRRVKQRFDPAGSLAPGIFLEGTMNAFDATRRPERELIDDCVHCGFCLPACPTYSLWEEEMDSPRGRIVLIKDALEQGAALSEVTVTHIDRCLGCMACVTACPSGVRYDKLLEDTRGQIERRYERPVSDRLFRRLVFALFTHPGRLRATTPALAAARRLGLPELARRRRGGLLDRTPRLRSLLALSPPAAPGGRGLERVTPARGPTRGRVALLQGCVQRVFFSGVNAATASVLAAEGFEVTAPRSPRCCGALQLHSGDDEPARELARRTIAAFEDYDYVVTNAAGCGSAMKDYAHLLRDDPAWAQRARVLRRARARRDGAAHRARAARAAPPAPGHRRLPRRLPSPPRAGRARGAAPAAP